MGCHVPRLAKNICNVVGRVRFPYGPHKRFVGVTANISDCLSDAMSSILIRTAVDHAAYALMVVLRSTKSEESVRITHAAPFAG